MAITWNVTIRETGRASANYNVSAQVTDDTQPPGRQTESVQVTGRMDTQAHKEALFDALHQAYKDRVSKANATAALESEAKTYLEAKL